METRVKRCLRRTTSPRGSWQISCAIRWFARPLPDHHCRSRGVKTQRRVRGTNLFDIAPFTRLGSSKSYSKTKLMDIMFSQDPARQLQDTGIAVHCLDTAACQRPLGGDVSPARQALQGRTSIPPGSIMIPVHPASLVVPRADRASACRWHR
jgi:NAD(P)-dependent dehydrogenase (short-subunit alcohol dehydrogenase family)